MFYIVISEFKTTDFEMTRHSQWMRILTQLDIVTDIPSGSKDLNAN